MQFAAEHVRKELEQLLPGGERGTGGKGAGEHATLFDAIAPANEAATTPPVTPPEYFRDLIIAGPAPAPLLRAETFYRYQLMLRTRAMTRLSRELARITTSLELPEDVTLTTDIDPVSLS